MDSLRAFFESLAQEWDARQPPDRVEVLRRMLAPFDAELKVAKAILEGRNNGFLLTGLLGEQKFVPGEVKTIDFVNKHSVVLGVDITKHEEVGRASF